MAIEPVTAKQVTSPIAIYSTLFPPQYGTQMQMKTADERVRVTERYCNGNCDHIGLKDSDDSWHTRGERSTCDPISCKKRESTTSTISRKTRNMARNLKTDDDLCWTGGDLGRDCNL